MTLDKLIESVEGINGIEIIDNCFVVRNLDDRGRDYSCSLDKIRDFKVKKEYSMAIWLQTGKTVVKLFYKNGDNESTLPWRESHPSIRQITHYSWEA